MPKNHRESLIYTVLMCFVMVLWISVYNVAMLQGELSFAVVQQAWLGFPIAYVFAMCCDWFFVSKIAKGFAFRFLVKPGVSSPRKMVIAVSCCMVDVYKRQVVDTLNVQIDDNPVFRVHEVGKHTVGEIRRCLLYTSASFLGFIILK